MKKKTRKKTRKKLIKKKVKRKIVKKQVKRKKKVRIKKRIKKYKIKKTSFSIKDSTIKKKLNINSKSFLLRVARFQNNLKFNFKLNFNLFSKIESSIQGFFESIEKNIKNYKIIRQDEQRRQKLLEIEKKEKEKIENKKAIEEQAEKQRQFLHQIKLEKQIEKFRIREVIELEKLERVSLREQREDYAGLQERIEKLKEKYRIIRDQKIRERVEALGIQIQGDEDRETLLSKEKEYTIARQKIEFCLESFYRSANSLVFQLNKRHITRNMSILRCIDRRFETGEIFIKWDESNDDEWLVLIYIKNNSPDEGIIIEDKSNPEKNLSHEYKSNEIFKASDMMVDSLTQLISKERSKKSIN